MNMSQFEWIKIIVQVTTLFYRRQQFFVRLRSIFIHSMILYHQSTGVINKIWDIETLIKFEAMLEKV